MIEFLQSIFEILQELAGSFSNAIDYVKSGYDVLISGVAVFPSFWSVFPSQITTVAVAIIAVFLGASLLNRLLIH